MDQETLNGKALSITETMVEAGRGKDGKPILRPKMEVVVGKKAVDIAKISAEEMHDLCETAIARWHQLRRQWPKVTAE